MLLCYVNICHKNLLFGGLLKVIVLYCIAGDHIRPTFEKLIGVHPIRPIRALHIY